MKQGYFRKRIGLGLLPILALVVVFLMAGVASGAVWPKELRVIVPTPGTAIEIIPVGMGRIVQKYTPAKQWIVQALGGPPLWLPMMAKGQCDFAVHNSADILDAFLGRKAYTRLGPQRVRKVMGGHQLVLAFWTTPDTGIKSVEDLKGKVAFVKYKANPINEEYAKHALNSAGLTSEDLKAVLSFSTGKEGIRGLIEGRVDAMIFPVVPGPVMQINEAKGETKFVTLTRKQAEYVAEHIEGYYIRDIAANDPRYRNKSPIPNAICFQTALWTWEARDPDIVYGVTKAILEHSDEFVDVHPMAKYWSLKEEPVHADVPYHDGAIRFYKEKGMWPEKMEAHQEKMLKKQDELLKKQ